MKRRSHTTIEKYEDVEPDWESGTTETFLAKLKQEAQDTKLSRAVYDPILNSLVPKIEDIASAEQGMWARYHDLGEQYWLATFIIKSIQEAYSFSENKKTVNAENLLLHSTHLGKVLQENIDAAVSRKNVSPDLDLQLHNHKNLLKEIIDLNKKIELLIISVEEQTPIETKLIQLAIKEFVLNLFGTAGEGIGKTVSWGVRIGIAYMAISVLESMGVKVGDLWQHLEGNH